MITVSFRKDILSLKDQLYRLALRLTMDEEESKDIVQETMIRVWNKRESWSEIESIEAYTFRICRNLALDSLKKTKPISLTSTKVEEPQIDAMDRIIERDQVGFVKDIINSLPEKQKIAIQLREFEGKSYKDIALIMDISEDQVKVNIFRARQTLKNKVNELEENGL